MLRIRKINPFDLLVRQFAIAKLALGISLRSKPTSGIFRHIRAFPAPTGCCMAASLVLGILKVPLKKACYKL